MSTQPTGNVTFLFTDIQGSTKLWDKYPVGMRAALAKHDAIMREVIEQHNGHVFKTIGDAFCAAFPTPNDGVLATLNIQRALMAQEWGEVGSIKVRMAVHAGEAECRDNDYFGQPLNRVARLRDTAHGGQVVVTEEVYKAVADKGHEYAFQDKGYHKLKDLAQPEHVYQLCAQGLPREFPVLRTLSTHPNNLPAANTSFIGREVVVQDICERLAEDEIRLLTLTGFGGLGKTRLSLRVGEKVLERFPEGVWFVPLAPISDTALVLPTIARALGLKDDPNIAPLDQLIAYLAKAHALLILDNFEQVEEAAPDIAPLLAGCPDIKILVTSRCPLDLSMEYEFEVPPLQTAESVTLFAARARQARSSFAVDSENARQVETLCSQLEGMPLAVELASAQIRKLSLIEISSALSRRLEVLSTNMRDLTARQRSLRGAIEWSYDLLNTTERSLFDALSVFVGGFDLEAVETICEQDGGSEAALSLLLSLREQSLIGVAQEGSRRFTLLESLRQYGAEQLEKAGRGYLLRSRHREFFLHLAETAEPHLTGPEQGIWLDRLEREHGNMRAALQWCEVAHDCATQGMRMASLLTPFWDLRGYYREGRDTLAGLLELTAELKPTLERAGALRSAGLLAWWQSDYETAKICYEQSLDIAQKLQDTAGIAAALSGLGDVAYIQGGYSQAENLQLQSLNNRQKLQDEHGMAVTLLALGNIVWQQNEIVKAREYYEQCLVKFQRLGDQRYAAMVLSNLGNIANFQEDYEAARGYYEQGLAIQRDLGDKLRLGASLFNIAVTVFRQQDYVSAQDLLIESIQLFQELGSKQYVALSLWYFASLANTAGRFYEPERATRLFGAAEALHKAIESPLPTNSENSHQSTMDALRETLGDERFAASWEEGCCMTLEAATEYAVTETKLRANTGQHV